VPKLVAVVGRKHSGKTTVIEHLIAELKRRGYRVGAIKEMVRISTLDTPAKETDRLQRVRCRNYRGSSARRNRFIHKKTSQFKRDFASSS